MTLSPITLLRLSLFTIIAFGMLLFLTPSSAAQTPPSQLTPAVTRVPPDAMSYFWEQIATNLDRPILLTHAGDGSKRLFVAEQGGTIMILKGGAMLPIPFLDLSATTGDEAMRGGYTERGLLGLAFSPDFSKTGVFFVNYTLNNGGETILARYTVRRDDPNQADPASATILLRIPQPHDNHNGGHLAFGRDGYLYMATGDGGGMGDPERNGQKTDTLHGKLLRLDVSDLSATAYAIPPTNPFVGNPAYAPEIWALGLRNPWRYSMDRYTGDLYIADVGQWQKEEINYQAASSTGGENYGWNVQEGDQRYDGENALPDAPDPALLATFTAPVAVYDHSFGCSVTGGYVYRGRSLPALWGVYLYGDYCNGRLWTLYQNPDGVWVNTLFMETGKQITSFGEDESGELYLVDYKGAVYRLSLK
ncbi:MAG TPA: PQQ-dependent sugar dehydrogenase [Aggregatilineales bacterium]|nr:PQQ-dependent sugar dehydrogenase [Anaerolineales bacterium]HRE49302.1 PQQ-dependent sugar dehydrogenase [Aggregatilineales bacterium]